MLNLIIYSTLIVANCELFRFLKPVSFLINFNEAFTLVISIVHRKNYINVWNISNFHVLLVFLEYYGMYMLHRVKVQNSGSVLNIGNGPQSGSSLYSKANL